MNRIVNLSACHGLKSIREVMKAFAALCDRYSTGCCMKHCPSLFSNFTNQAWVAYIYQKNLNTLINPYKLGKINTQEFIEGLLEIFSFLGDDNFVPTKNELIASGKLVRIGTGRSTRYRLA